MQIEDSRNFQYVVKRWGLDNCILEKLFLCDCSRHLDRAKMKQQSAQGVWDLGMRSAYARGGATMMPAVQLAMGPPGWCAEAAAEEGLQCQPQQRLWPDGEFGSRGMLTCPVAVRAKVVSTVRIALRDCNSVLWVVFAS